MDHKPLVVKAGQLAGALKQHSLMGEAAPRAKVVRISFDPFNDSVVKFQKGKMELGDDEVLIVTGVTDEGSRPKIGIGLLLIRENILLDDAGIQQYPDAWQIPVEIVFGWYLVPSDRRRLGIVGVPADSEAGAVVEASILAVGVDKGWPITVDTIEIGCGSAQIKQFLGDFVRGNRCQVGFGDVTDSGVAIRIGGQVVDR